jgi:hypothetical protein
MLLNPEFYQRLIDKIMGFQLPFLERLFTEARGRIDFLRIMASGGGFFIGPTHNFQCDIPTENIVAMYETAGSWKYH